jgi:hypothetical protein
MVALCAVPRPAVIHGQARQETTAPKRRERKKDEGVTEGRNDSIASGLETDRPPLVSIYSSRVIFLWATLVQVQSRAAVTVRGKTVCCDFGGDKGGSLFWNGRGIIVPYCFCYQSYARGLVFFFINLNVTRVSLCLCCFDCVCCPVICFLKLSFGISWSSMRMLD